MRLSNLILLEYCAARVPLAIALDRQCVRLQVC